MDSVIKVFLQLRSIFLLWILAHLKCFGRTKSYFNLIRGEFSHVRHVELKRNSFTSKRVIINWIQSTGEKNVPFPPKSIYIIWWCCAKMYFSVWVRFWSMQRVVSFLLLSEHLLCSLPGSPGCQLPGVKGAASEMTSHISQGRIKWPGNLLLSDCRSTVKYSCFFYKMSFTSVFCLRPVW